MSMGDWFSRNFSEWKPPYTQTGYRPSEEIAKDLMRHKPRLAVVNHAPSREEFAAWRDDPTTLFVFAALRAAANEQKQAWQELSWEGNDPNPQALVEFRTRADAYASLEEGDYEDFCAWAGVEPEPIAEGDE